MCTWRPLPPPCGPRSHRGGRFFAGSDGFQMTFGLENCDYLATVGVLENTAGSPTMWFLGSVLFSVLFGSVSSQGIQNIMKNSGDDVTLMCEDPEFKKDITVLEWSREYSEILFVSIDGRPFPSVQHESFRNRVFLNDSQMKDGDLSVVLKNVTMKDTGTYQCRVLHKYGSHKVIKTISTIFLSGDPSPGDPSPDKQNIMKKPGDDVTLMCRDPEYEKDITVLEWRRTYSEILFVFRDGQPSPSDQHESFRNRVFLNDSQMKDGDLSVVLENVTMNDSGTYMCRVRHEYGDPLILISSTVYLSVVPPDKQIKKNPGDDVTLMCRDPEYKKDITALEWSKEDSEIVFMVRDGQPLPSATHESFRNRVFLKDSQMKDGDLSVVLKNVTMNDTGTYQCRVRHEDGDPLILMSTVHLFVVPPGDPSPGEQGGLSPGGITGIVLAVLVLVPAAAVLWIYRKKKGSNQSSSGSNNQQNPEQDGLKSDP